MVKAYFTACEQAFPAQRAQLRRIALALCRGGVERMEELCRLYAQTPERLMEIVHALEKNSHKASNILPNLLLPHKKSV